MRVFSLNDLVVKFWKFSGHPSPETVLVLPTLGGSVKLYSPVFSARTDAQSTVHRCWRLISAGENATLSP
jgi:hypothetical protein